MNLLDLTPVVSADVEEQDGRVVIIRPKPILRGLRGPIDWLIYMLAPGRIRLDDVGSFCWRHIDGRHTAGEIAEAMRAEFGESIEPAEERLGTFMRLLQREDLVSFVDH